MTEIYVGNYPCDLVLGTFAFSFHIKATQKANVTSQIMVLFHRMERILQEDMNTCDQISIEKSRPLYLTIEGKKEEIKLHRMDGTHRFLDILLKKEPADKVDRVIKTIEEMESVLTSIDSDNLRSEVKE